MQSPNSWSEQQQRQWAKTREGGERRYLLRQCLLLSLPQLSALIGMGVVKNWSHPGSVTIDYAVFMSLGAVLSLAIVIAIARWMWRRNEAAFASHLQQSIKARP